MHPLKYLAELLGTFTLALAVGLSVLKGMPLPTPVVAGLTLGLLVYTIGGISGAQINPAVTLGLWSVGKMNGKDTLLYLVAQVAGGLLAYGALRGLGFESAVPLTETSWQAGLAEAVGAFFLIFGVSAVVYKKVHEAAAGLTIGGSLLLGILLTAGFSQGVLNPAVALGLDVGNLSVVYTLGPIVGAVLGAWAFKGLAAKR